MKTLNIVKKFILGKTVVAIKEFKNGDVCISVGDQGVIKGITTESFLDLGLISIKILHMDFGKHRVSMGARVAEGYFSIV